ncbi:hypothetical protein [Roseateles sp.]|uniref:hypothetical protein n=1 Tax=Roseateles sp. TaxID=1971397 RepID=UPI003267E894
MSLLPNPSDAPEMEGGDSLPSLDQQDDPGQRAKRLEWMEKQAADNIKARFATAEIVSKEAQVTLTVLLAGVAGAGASAAPLFSQLSNGEQVTPLPLAFAAACIYLTWLAVWLVAVGMRFASFPAAFQDPKNLLCDEAEQRPWNKLREEELRAVQIRIQDAAKINRERSSRLNHIRLAACLTPAFTVAAFVVVLQVLPPPVKQRPSTLAIDCTVALPSVASSASMRLSCVSK